MQPQLLFVCLALRIASSFAVNETQPSCFTRRYVRTCLRSQFVRSVTIPVPDATLCGIACTRRGAECRGFRLLTGPAAVCQVFEFNRCSGAVKVPDDECSRQEFGWVFVRRQAGVPKGQLCPGGFGHGWLGSTYSLVDVADWNGGLAKCNSMAGLTKFADGDNIAEVSHLHWIKRNVNSGQSIFVGGFRPGGSVSDPWFWHDCNSTFLPVVWGSGQPNEGVSANRVNVWASHADGIDDVPNMYSSITKALCECVDPFA